MNAEEIRAIDVLTLDESEAAQTLAFSLREIAAQLAELNQHMVKITNPLLRMEPVEMESKASSLLRRIVADRTAWNTVADQRIKWSSIDHAEEFLKGKQ